MTPQLIGVAGVAFLLLLLFARIPVAIATGLVGIVGYGLLNGFGNALQITGLVPFEVVTNYSLSQLPLFVLMGDLAVRSGMSGRLFEATSLIFSGIRGSRAMATIGASAGFGAVSGSSIATAATMTRVAMPAMRDARYHDQLAMGSIGAGGTLGILIPPSIALVVYAMIAEQSLPRLYAASLIPGIVLIILYLAVVVFQVKRHADWAPEESSSLRLSQRLVALSGVWEIVILFTVVIGGIYSGILTANEAAAVGVFGAWLLGVVTRRLTPRETFAGVMDTIKITAMLFIVLVSANIFTYFVVFTQLPDLVIGLAGSFDLSPTLVMIILIFFYLILGCFLEAFGIVLITVPIFLPLATSVGFDPIWFGVFLVLVIEMGMITPPVGMNIFVMQAQVPQVKITTIYAGVLPYLAAPIFLLLLLIFVPDVALWLPDYLFQ